MLWQWDPSLGLWHRLLPIGDEQLAFVGILFLFFPIFLSIAFGAYSHNLSKWSSLSFSIFALYLRSQSLHSRILIVREIFERRFHACAHAPTLSPAHALRDLDWE